MGLVALNLRKGDEVNVYNVVADSVEVYRDGPFTFIGYHDIVQLHIAVSKTCLMHAY